MRFLERYLARIEDSISDPHAADAHKWHLKWIKNYTLSIPTQTSAIRKRARERSYPNKKVIRKYWAPYLVSIGRFDSEFEVMDGDYCFACGWERKLEKAHILAHADRGTEVPSNLHMLCKGCHKASEYLSGDDYFDWFENSNRTINTVMGNDYPFDLFKLMMETLKESAA